jgi:hypothetical protein
MNIAAIIIQTPPADNLLNSHRRAGILLSTMLADAAEHEQVERSVIRAAKKSFRLE